MTIPLPPGESLYPYQEEGVPQLVRKLQLYGSALQADEMGLGKTAQAIAVCNCSKRINSVLVVCPASLKINWAREWARFSTRGLTVGIAGKTWPETNVVVINYDILGKFKPDNFDLVIYDEAHYLKNPDAKRTKLALAIPARYRLFLTGTPILNRPVELWPIMAMSLPRMFPKFWTFAQRYCAPRRVGWGNGWDFGGASNLPELNVRLYDTIMVRRLKADVLRDLPPKTRQVIELPLAGKARLVEAERRAVEALDSHYEGALRKLEEGGVAGGLAAIAKIRHEIALAKVPAAADHITDVVEAQGKVVVFGWHQDVIDALAEELKALNPVVVTGSTPLAKRQAKVDAFQTDPSVRVFIGNIQAAGVGLTLTASSTVVFVELCYVPGQLSQAEDRVHRIGQRENVLVQHLVVDGSIDVTMAKRVVAKQAVIDKALNL